VAAAEAGAEADDEADDEAGTLLRLFTRFISFCLVYWIVLLT